MKWTVKLVSEITPGQREEYDLVELERTHPMTPANLGLAIADGKAILAAVQKQMVTHQVQQHCEMARNCKQCGAELPTKGQYTSPSNRLSARSPLLSAASEAAAAKVSGTRAIQPCCLQEFLPVAETVNAGTIRNRTLRVGKRLEKHREEVVPSPVDTNPAVKKSCDRVGWRLCKKLPSTAGEKL